MSDLNTSVGISTGGGSGKEPEAGFSPEDFAGGGAVRFFMTSGGTAVLGGVIVVVVSIGNSWSRGSPL